MPQLTDGLHKMRSWATLVHWLPTYLMLSLNPLLGLPLSRFPPLGVHADVILAHPVLFILATCPAHCPFMHCTFPIISFTTVLDLIIPFRILSFFMMFNNNLSMLRWAPARFFSWCFVSPRLCPIVIAGKITTVSMIFIFRQIGIFLSV